MDQNVAEGIAIPQQLVLRMFEDLRIDGRSIASCSKEVGFSKPNLFIDVADLGLVARKVLNACHYIAVTTSPEANGLFVADLEFFKWLINYDKSNNLTHLRKAVREAQKSAIQLSVVDMHDPGRDQWVSVPMLSTAGISGGKVAFKIPDEVKPHLLDPTTYTFLSLRITAAISSSYALTLYEKLSALRFRGGTDWMELDAFRKWLGIENVKTLAEYKNITRYVFGPSLKQINELSDIFVEIKKKFTAGNRRVTHIQFTVRDNPNGKLNLRNAYKDEIRELYVTLTEEFGLDRQAMDEIMSNRELYTDERIRAAVEFSRARMNEKTRFPGKYLMKALRDGLKLSTIEKDLQERRKKMSSEGASKEPASDPREKASMSAARVRLAALGETELAELLSRFGEEKAGNKLLSKAIRDKGLKSKMVETALVQWMAKQAELVAA